MFGVGDRVRCKHEYSNYGAEGTILLVKSSNVYYVEWDNKLSCQDYAECYLELISKKTNPMKDILTVFRNLNLKEPEKTFREAQITDTNGNLTSTGNQIFLSYLLAKHGEDFKKNIVDPILLDMKMGDCNKL